MFTAPLRSFFSTILVVYTFLSGPSSSIFTPPSGRHFSHTPLPVTGGASAIRNRVFFTFMFFETMSWFWIWVTLREERDALVEKLKRNHRVNED
jgi:hypothetical protein